jgi:3-oxoacid CoA-transferase subunit B
VTDIAVIRFTDKGLVLEEIVPGWTVEEVQAVTEPRLIVSPDLKEVTL